MVRDEIRIMPSVALNLVSVFVCKIRTRPKQLQFRIHALCIIVMRLVLFSCDAMHSHSYLHKKSYILRAYALCITTCGAYLPKKREFRFEQIATIERILMTKSWQILHAKEIHKNQSDHNQ